MSVIARIEELEEQLRKCYELCESCRGAREPYCENPVQDYLDSILEFDPKK